MNYSNLKIGTRLSIGFGLIISLLVVLLSSNYWNFHKLGQANSWNTHTYQVHLEVDQILESLVNIETGERGFALTGNDASLEPLVKGKEDFLKHFNRVKSLTSD